jgi:hypothetical protein
MEKISLGKTELDEYDFRRLDNGMPTDVRIKKIVYWYEYEDYSGHGVAAYLDNKGKWHVDGLGHCSCYGAFDNGFNPITYTKEQAVELLKKNYSREYDGGLIVAKYLEEME